MTEEEKTVHISARVSSLNRPIKDSETTAECKSCGEEVVISGSNHEVDKEMYGIKPMENIDPEDVDQFMCEVCGLKMMKYRGQAG